MKKILLTLLLFPTLTSAQIGGVISDLKVNYLDGPLQLVGGSEVTLHWKTRGSNYCYLTLPKHGGKFENVVVFSSQENTIESGGVYPATVPDDFPITGYTLNCSTSHNAHSSDHVEIKIFSEKERQEIILQLRINIFLLIEELKQLLLKQQSQ